MPLQQNNNHHSSQYPKRKLEFYNPDYSPKDCPKAFIESDSIPSLKEKPFDVFQHKFFPVTDTATTGSVAPEFILLNKRNSDVSETYSDYILIGVIFLLFIVAWIRIFYSKVLINLTKSVFNYQWTKKMFEERNSLTQRVYLLLDFIFIANASLSVYYLLVSLKPIATFPINPLIISFSFISFVYFVRLFGIFLGGYLSDTLGDVFEYISHTGIYLKATGLVLFLPILALGNAPKSSLNFLLILTFLILATGYLFTIIRGFLYAWRTKFLFFYYFLYFCAIEILPLILCLKYFGILK